MDRRATNPSIQVRGHSSLPGDVEGIQSILGRWLSKNRPFTKLGQNSPSAEWKEAVGEEIAASTRCIKLSGGTLFVEVSSAPLLNELSTFRKKEILERIKAREVFRGVREIRFRAGSS